MTRGEQDARGEQVRGSVPVGETGQALLEALLTVSPVGLHVLDTELRVVRINTATPAMRGVRAQDLLGRRLTEAYGLVDPDGMEALARGVLETGLPVLDRIVRIRPPEEPDDERFHSISAFRLADRRGRALGPAVAAVDVTDRERARGGLALLEAVHRGVGRTLDTVVTCRELADVLVPAFAEVPEGGVLVLAGLPDADGDPAGPRGDALPGPPDGAPPGLRAALRKSPVGGAGPLQDLCDEIVYRRDQAAGRADGAVLLLARTRAFPADRVAAWPLEADLAAVAVARRHVRARLRDWGVDEETASNTELIVSELVTNAVRHGAPPLTLRLIHDRTLTCEVRDHSLAAPLLRHARAADEGGRGLFIVSRLAQLWGTCFAADGKTLWTEKSLPAPPDRAGPPA